MSYTLSDVLQFFDYAEQKGLLKPNAAKANKAVVARVASVLDAAEQAQLNRLATDEIYARFRTKFALELSPDSLRVYKSRFHSALESFQKWRKAPESSLVKPPMRADTAITVPIPAKPQITQSGRRLLPEIPVPLADGGIAIIVGMPQNLSAEEAERFKRIIESYTQN